VDAEPITAELREQLLFGKSRAQCGIVVGPFCAWRKEETREGEDEAGVG